jgi:hypothetical protein
VRLFENYTTLYPSGDQWYITSTSWPAAGPLSQSVATLVFQVMNVAGSTHTDIVPVITTLTGTGGADFSGSTTVVPLSIHVGDVPEPVTALLVGFGLVGLAAWRKRAS